jgi:hypothetical protein
MKGALAVLALSAGIAEAGIIVQAPPPVKDPAVPPEVSPKATPPLSPSAPTSPGAVVIRFKLEMLDKDRDGFVSRGEAEGVPELIKVFDKLDANRDGRLDQAELDAYHK